RASLCEADRQLIAEYRRRAVARNLDDGPEVAGARHEFEVMITERQEKHAARTGNPMQRPSPEEVDTDSDEAAGCGPLFCR
ncbi:MAG TPA: hypothetical protein VHW74_14365, partial [Mycobacteriales bacterium]|nr:hypothetical protein [Mycobacteriales bacterium]